MPASSHVQAEGVLHVPPSPDFSLNLVPTSNALTQLLVISRGSHNVGTIRRKCRKQHRRRMIRPKTCIKEVIPEEFNRQRSPRAQNTRAFKQQVFDVAPPVFSVCVSTRGGPKIRTRGGTTTHQDTSRHIKTQQDTARSQDTCVSYVTAEYCAARVTVSALPKPTITTILGADSADQAQKRIRTLTTAVQCSTEAQCAKMYSIAMVYAHACCTRRTCGGGGGVGSGPPGPYASLEAPWDACNCRCKWAFIRSLTSRGSRGDDYMSRARGPCVMRASAAARPCHAVGVPAGFCGGLCRDVASAVWCCLRCAPTGCRLESLRVARGTCHTCPSPPRLLARGMGDAGVAPRV